MLSLDDDLDGTWPFAPRVSTASGHRMHYVDEGRGSPILCLHGQPTWGYLWRNVIPPLAREHRVVAPDLLGFGKSDTPAGWPYSVTAHVDAIEALVRMLDLRDLTLVLHDWGGAIGGGLALRIPERVTRLVVVNSAVPLGLPGEAEHGRANLREARYFRWMAELHASGELETVLGRMGAFVSGTMRELQGLERGEAVTSAWLRAYGAPLATPGECAGAIAFPRSMVDGTVAFERGTPEAVAAVRRTPALLVYGMRDRVLLPSHFIPLFEAAFPGAPIVRLERAGHFVQEDAPEAVAAAVGTFIGVTGPR